jgi:hypothetical protein
VDDYGSTEDAVLAFEGQEIEELGLADDAVDD